MYIYLYFVREIYIECLQLTFVKYNYRGWGLAVWPPKPPHSSLGLQGDSDANSSLLSLYYYHYYYHYYYYYSITITITIIIVIIINYTIINLPPLIITPPNKNKPFGGKSFFTINLDGGTITPS